MRAVADLDDPARLSKLTRAVTQIEDDPVLQDIVARASALAGCPMALVSLITGKLQLFRAATGLPPELDVSRAGSRQDSFCQFVVRGEDTFVVTHAEVDTRVPQALTQFYGVQAYAGVPVRVEDQVLGSLCVVDVQPREFAGETLTQLEALGREASARLQALYEADVALDEPAAVPSLADELALRARVVERSLAEVGPYLRLARKVGTDQLSPEQVTKATMALHEAADYFELLFAEVRDMRRRADTLQRAANPA